MTGEERWVLPDRTAALEWCAKRKGQHIRCALDVLGRSAKTEDDVQGGLSAHLELLETIMADDRGASLAVKLSTLGAGFDREQCQKHLLAISKTAWKGPVPLELDMEGRGSVDFTLRTAIEAASTGLPVTLALQAYLDRTPADLERAIDDRVRVRLVKGAYAGDTDDFLNIQKRMRDLAGRLAETGAEYCVGTHDPELVGWLEERGSRGCLEFGFLMGLADETKLRLASSGWRVLEYVPFGPESGPYIARRERYLKGLERLGRTPAP